MLNPAEFWRQGRTWQRKGCSFDKYCGPAIAQVKLVSYLSVHPRKRNNKLPEKLTKKKTSEAKIMTIKGEKAVNKQSDRLGVFNAAVLQIVTCKY